MKGPDDLVKLTDVAIHWIEAVAALFLAIAAAGYLAVVVYDAAMLLMKPSLAGLQEMLSAMLMVFVIVELYTISVEFMQGGPVIDRVAEVGLVVLVRQMIVAEFLHMEVAQLLAIAALIVALGLARFLTQGGRGRYKAAEAK